MSIIAYFQCEKIGKYMKFGYNKEGILALYLHQKGFMYNKRAAFKRMEEHYEQI